MIPVPAESIHSVIPTMSRRAGPVAELQLLRHLRSGEIWDEIDEERSRGREIIGCAHYHIQDTESDVEGRGVYLSYGSVLEGDQPSIDIGPLIVKAMQAEGLTVTWNGSLDQRIHVALDWKRRLPEDALSAL